MLVTIQEYIANKLVENSYLTNVQLGEMLGVKRSMASQYRRGYYPSLEVAKRVYALDKVVLHPFSEESLIHEITQG
jgi:predicted transcriptional regulator